MPFVATAPRMSIRLAIISSLLVLSAACRDAASPHSRLELLAPPDTVAGVVSAATGPVVYRTAVKAGQQLALYLDGGSNVIMTALSSSGTLLGLMRGSGDPSGATTRSYLLPRASSDQLYDIEIAIQPNDAQEGTYRLRAAAVDPRPEHTSSAITIGTVVDEAIDHPADIDEFTFTATAGQQLEIYVQQLDAVVPDGVVVTLRQDGSQSFVGGATSTPPNYDFESRASGPITVPATGAYRLSVQSSAAVPAYVGAYRFEVLAIDTLPEHASATLAIGDTIANESIDHVGDIDTFTLAAAPGSEFNLFLDASGAPPHGATAEVVGRYDLTTTATAGGAPLLQNASGRFTMPPSGSLTIRVHDVNIGPGVYRGPYRLFVSRIDHAPEGIPPTIVAGAPAITSAIEVPGDIDEYSFTLGSTAILNLVLTRGADAVGGMLQVQLGGIPGASYDPVYYLASPATTSSTSHLELRPGTYKLTVMGTSSRGDGYRGTYQLELRPVNPAPESIPALIAVSDTVRGESLEYAGDVDTFALPVVAGDTFNIKLSTPGQTNPGLYFQLVDPTTNLIVGSGTSQSGRLAPDPGQYKLVVAALDGGATLTQKGAYELVIDRVSARPEHHQAALAFGDTVRDEKIDYPGDYDDFVLRGQPGQEIFAAFTWVPDGSMGPYLNGSGSLAILDSASGAILGGTPSYGGTGLTKRVTLPSSGVVRVRVQGLAAATGGYWFTVLPINRAPETRAAAFTLGDTVADAIDPSMDIDEFTFSGVAGQSVDMFFQAPNGLASPGFSGLQLDLIDQTTGAVVATLTTYGYTANLEDINRRAVVLPSSGQYLVRVQSTPDQLGNGNYRFRIAASP
jgi:hypothetical protein